MRKYLILFFILFCLPLFARADLSISEILYDASGTDTDHEWIEVYNPGTSAVTLDGWQFSDGTNHNLNKPPTNGSTGDFTVPAGGYVILAANAVTFLSDHSGLECDVVDTVMSLNNTGATLKILKDGVEQDNVAYTSGMGGAGDGNSLQIVDGELAPGAPTLCASNEAGGMTSGDNPTIPPTDEATPLVIPPMSATLTAPAIITAGIDTSFKSIITDYNDKGEKLTLEVGTFKWNFGDGTTATVLDQSAITHKYFEPGDYVVVLDYSEDKTGIIGTDVSKRVTISVQPAGIVISNVSADGKISIKNSSSREQDISNWNISDNGRIFVFANNTIILAGKTLTIGEGVLGFKPLHTDVVNLNKPSGESAFVYRPVTTLPVKPKVLGVKSTSPQSPSDRDGHLSTASPAKEREDISQTPTPPVSLVSETTSPSQREEINANPKNSITPYLAGTVFGVLVIGSVFGTMRVRRRARNKVEDGLNPDDFKILE